MRSSRYERAIQIDASNPYAYLALARHYVDVRGTRERALELPRATPESLFEALDDDDAPGAETHIDSVSAVRAIAAGRALPEKRTRELLDRAARRAPDALG